MSWLFFLDESGHDHKIVPLEVRGGVAIHASKLWNFIQAWQRLERDCFGLLLAEAGKEAKGLKLLDRDRMKWATQGPVMDGDLRRKHSRRFISAGKDGTRPSRDDFTAYGQACLEMARGVFDLLVAHEARLFATAIRRGVKPPADFERSDFLRKDHVFLFERFSYFLEAERQHGLIVMDESDKAQDRRFIERMNAYFTKTATGRNRSYWIVPSPMFVSSDMSYPVQAADICLYAINWGFRVPGWAVAEEREDIRAEFEPKIRRLQWQGQGYRDGRVYQSWGIALVDDPYGPKADR